MPIKILKKSEYLYYPLYRKLIVLFDNNRLDELVLI